MDPSDLGRLETYLADDLGRLVAYLADELVGVEFKVRRAPEVRRINRPGGPSGAAKIVYKPVEGPLPSLADQGLMLARCVAVTRVDDHVGVEFSSDDGRKFRLNVFPDTVLGAESKFGLDVTQELDETLTFLTPEAADGKTLRGLTDWRHA